MKHLLFFSVIIFLFTCPLNFDQTLGFSAGYGSLKMNKVDKDLKDDQDLFSSLGIPVSAPDDINGGFFAEGNIKFDLGKFNIGFTADYTTSSGNFSYLDATGSYEESYDVKTIELLGLFEIPFPIENSTVQPFIQLAGGAGFASADHLANLNIYDDPSSNLSVKNTLSGNYFSGRIKGGLQFVLQKVVLELAVGYRIANAGELKGDLSVNGIMYYNYPVYDKNSNSIEFDYSGVFVTGGIAFPL